MPLLASCAFDLAGLDRASDDAAVSAPIDARVPMAADATPPDATPAADAPPPPPPFCDPADPTQAACWRFEGSAVDGSAYANHGVATSVSWAAGHAGGQAVRTTAPGAIRVADSPSLNVTAAITLEMWVRADSLPTAPARAGLIDDNGQYGLFVHPGGELLCVLAGVSNVARAAGQLPLAAWTHVACSWDGAAITLYVNGVAVLGVPATGAIDPVGASDGMAIGGNSPAGDAFDGLIDDVRVWNVARSPTDVCRAAGTC